MKRTPVASSNIISIGYDKNRQTLEIEFTNGAVYQYFDFPEDKYQGLISSESIGRYFYDSIKHKYSFSKLSDNSFHEFEFVLYLSKLLKGNNKFSNVILEPSFTDSQKRILRPDIACEYQNNKMIIEAKKVAPLTEKRVFEYINQIKRYKELDDDLQLVIAFPEELQRDHEKPFQNENIIVWDISTLASIFSNQLEVIRETPLYPIIFNAGVKEEVKSQSILFIEELASIKPGKNDWSKFQKFIANCMEYLFAPPLGKPLYELADTNKSNRRDIILPNYAESGFWKFLRDNYFAHYIVVDAKNLSKHVEKKDVLQILNYLKKFGTGLFGIIVSRNKPHSNAILTQREHWIVDNKLIVFLHDEDIVQMLTMKDSSGNPEEVIRQKIEDFRLGL